MRPCWTQKTVGDWSFYTMDEIRCLFCQHDSMHHMFLNEAVKWLQLYQIQGVEYRISVEYRNIHVDEYNIRGGPKLDLNTKITLLYNMSHFNFCTITWVKEIFLYKYIWLVLRWKRFFTLNISWGNLISLWKYMNLRIKSCKYMKNCLNAVAIDSIWYGTNWMEQDSWHA